MSKNIKYSICYLLRGEAEKFHKKKVKEPAKKFKENQERGF